MNSNSVNDIREAFIEYFANNDHKIVKSAPLIPQNDPSLMFVNSGMVQFKNIFTGIEKVDYKKAVSVQRCIRAGGKHNDLENVGYTARHHTFFEMLGNFSFGDYFKEKAILYAWSFLVKELSINKDRLYITVHQEDKESRKLWREIAGLSDDRIISINSDDNFWSMGNSGPCGYCSEIFYDYGDKVQGGLPGSPDEDGGRYVEIWNLVFMQYNQLINGKRIDLENQSIDTGMGLERIATVLQGVYDNYDIDIFKQIITACESLLGVKLTQSNKSSYKVISDHLRSSAFLISDGVMPSNEGRGYVLRRIIRRAVRHANQIGAKEPVLHNLLPVLVSSFQKTYPNIVKAENLISNILQQEEEKFISTLDRGLKLIHSVSENIENGGVLEGQTAFKLYDTYGFPVDLTADILKQRNISLDEKGFYDEMQKQKDRARANWSGSGQNYTNEIWFEILDKYGTTEFLGYGIKELSANILAIIGYGDKSQDKNKSYELIDKIIHNEEYDKLTPENKRFILIANQTPFYGESGGQMGDIGFITSDKCKIKVVDTLKFLGKIHAHICEIEHGVVEINDNVHLKIDNEYRHDLQIHHSATHILHAVMREVLGDHLTQKGSLVANNRLRFDVAHMKPITTDQLVDIENKVNEIVRHNSQVTIDSMPMDKAIDAGAMALFGEKYDDEVRVVAMGTEIDNKRKYSFELCGGTHVERTGDIGLFKIISEGSIASGVRRIEAVCSKYALDYVHLNEKTLSDIANLLQVNNLQLLEKVKELQISNKTLQQNNFDLQIDNLLASCQDYQDHAIKLRDAHLVYREISNKDNKLLRAAVELITSQKDDLIVIFIGKISGKLSVIVGVSKKLISLDKEFYDAARIIKIICENLDCKGSGRNNIAQAGGILVESKLENFRSKVSDILL